jgi:hypothetical protein
VCGAAENLIERQPSRNSIGGRQRTEPERHIDIFVLHVLSASVRCLTQSQIGADRKFDANGCWCDRAESGRGCPDRLEQTALIRSPVLVRIAHSSAPPQVDTGILNDILVGAAGTDLQEECIAIGPVLNMVAVRSAGFEPRAVTCSQHLLAAIRDEHDFTFQHPHELILRSVPVALA